MEFYDRHDDYPFDGVVVGRYYNADGSPTPELLAATAAIDRAKAAQAARKAEEQLLPPCNSRWSSAAGGAVWCTGRSGGVSRDWAGVPRQLFESPGSTQPRCVCVPDDKLDDPRLRLYPSCAVDASECTVSK